MKLPIPSEDSEQKLVVDWLDAHGVLYTHPANGGKRHISTARRMKVQGQKAGVPDLLIFDPPPAMPGIFAVAIEMKRRKGGKVSENQTTWLYSLSKRNWYTAICHGGDEAIDILQRLGYGRRTK